MKKCQLSLALLTTFSVLVLGGSALAAPPEGKGKPETGHGHKNAAPVVGVELAVAGVSFTAARELAVSYRYTGMKPLPPGIRKNLARGKPLPPGIAKRSLPAGMVAQLPVHAGYEWRVCGSDLVLVALATAVVADVLFDVFK